MSEEKNSKMKQDVHAAPVVVWEQTRLKPELTASKVVDLERYRNGGFTNLDQSEATVTNWHLISANQEERVRLIMVSSGFGKSTKNLGNSTIQSMVA
jgi:hypothetical protein